MLLDLNMPDINGVEVMEFIRSQERLRRLPIVVVTTRGDEASRDRALGAERTGTSRSRSRPRQSSRRSRASSTAGGGAELMAGGVNMGEFLAGFLAEADEHLASVNANLVAVEEGLRHRRNSPRAIRELFRSLHTMKGLASMVGADPIADLAHELEALLRDADARGGAISEGGLDALVHGVRALEERLRAMAQGGAPAPAPPAILEALIAARQAPLGRPAAAANLPPGLSGDVAAHLGPAEREQVVQALAAGRRVVELAFLPSRELSDRGLNITSVRERLSKIGELVRVVPRSVPGSPTGIGFGLLLLTSRGAGEVAGAAGLEASAIHASVEPPAPFAATLEDVEAEAAAEARGHVRVTTERLDEALERLSALVVTRFRLARAMARLGERGADVRELSAVLQENALQLRDLRAAIMQIRMVSLSEMLQRVPLSSAG